MWIGTALSKMELLTIKSFVSKGHEFRLWAYDALDLPEISGLVVMDANEIIDKSKVFSYKHKNTYGHGKGSYAGFSDIFRYKLLYEKGGWWVDMDIYCLKEFTWDEPYFFRNHHDLVLVGNVMKCPPKSELMLRCFEDSIKQVDENNKDWHLPIQILINHVSLLNLNGYIQYDVSNFDQWEETRKFISSRKKIPSNWYFIHWQNEEWRRHGYDKNNPRILSTLGQLLQKHDLLEKNSNIFKLLRNYIQTF
jgi:mannosyltransferase OCH1-like enzyme